MLRGAPSPADALGDYGRPLQQLQERKLRALAEDPSSEAIRTINFAESRRVRSSVAEIKLWLAPSNNDGSACLIIVEDDAEIAQPGPCLDAETKDHGSSAQVKTTLAGDIDVFGIVPDGVRTATLTLQNGRSTTIAVIDNVYVARVTSATSSVTFTGPGGPSTLSIPSG